MELVLSGIKKSTSPRISWACCILNQATEKGRLVNLERRKVLKARDGAGLLALVSVFVSHFCFFQEKFSKGFNLGVPFNQEGKMKSFSYLILLVLFFSNAAFADEASIKAAMEKKFPYEKVISVHKTHYFGLYEVVLNDQLVYTDEKMTYLFSGNIIDMHTMQNLTEEREKQLFAINFDSLPLNLAIKSVKGNGKRRMAIFTDPNCPYCKRQEKEMVNLTDATIYIFVLPILPGSQEKAKAIWCSSDRLQAWEDHMLKGVDPEPGKVCDTSALTKISMAAKKLDIIVTPTLVFEDGIINPGWMRLELLDEHLASSSSKK